MAAEKTAKVSSVLTPALRASKKKILKTPVKQLQLSRGFRVADLVGGMKGVPGTRYLIRRGSAIG